MKPLRIIISGGGTGGHVYPAIAIAEAIKEDSPEAQILFIGAEGRMEMEKVPQAGFPIVGLKIAGFDRKNMLKNLGLPFKVIGSLWKARKEIKRFNPQLVIGVGGYASGPTLKAANWMGIPTVIQEQNSFPGKTNLLLAKRASAICVAYPNMEKFFPHDKIHLTGNPIRSSIAVQHSDYDAGISFFNLEKGKKTVLVLGGSLGAKSINDGMVSMLEKIANKNELQVLWQCGKRFYSELSSIPLPPNLVLVPFLEKMDLAYAIADIIVSRAGATSISELTLIGKPTILIPSPNVSEDHQTKNAMALVERKAAGIVPDQEVKEKLWEEITLLLDSPALAAERSKEIRKMGLPNATRDIVQLCLSCIRKNENFTNG